MRRPYVLSMQLVSPIAFACLFSIMLAGCGSGDESGTDSDENSTSENSSSNEDDTSNEETTTDPGTAETAGNDSNTENEMSVTTADYGTTASGQDVTEFTCTNSNGMVMKMINYGATMTAIHVADRDGNFENVTLGYDTLEGYENGTAYFGATVGRFCNRIAGGKFTIDGTEYTLATNNGPNHLHGGEIGFSRVVWDAKPIVEDDEVGVEFTYMSKDGEEDYPGNVNVTAVYAINNDNELHMRLTATTDAPTHVNLTNHNYWNLAGAGNGTILDHILTLDAPAYLAVDDTLIPTGEQVPVEGTPLNFLEPTRVGERIEQVQIGDAPKGYDHCFVVADKPAPVAIATLEDKETGRKMVISTDSKGIQLYTGLFLDGSAGAGGFEQYGALCLETQLFPDSPNKADQPGFTSSLLKPGETFTANTSIKFSTE